MITQSGCFGNHYDPPIDDLEEARKAVADIIGSDTVENPAPCVQDPSASLAAGSSAAAASLISGFSAASAASLIPGLSASAAPAADIAAERSAVRRDLPGPLRGVSRGMRHGRGRFRRRGKNRRVPVRHARGRRRPGLRRLVGRARARGHRHGRRRGFDVHMARLHRAMGAADKLDGVCERHVRNSRARHLCDGRLPGDARQRVCQHAR